MSYPIGIYEHRAHLFAGLPPRDPRFAELDRQIASDEVKRKGGRPPGSKNKPKPTRLPEAVIAARPYYENGIMQREAHRKASETRRERYLRETGRIPERTA